MCSGEARERLRKPRERCQPTANHQKATSADSLFLQHGAAGPRRSCSERVQRREWSRQQTRRILVLARGLAVRFVAQEKRLPLQRARPQPGILQENQIPQPELQTPPLASRLFPLHPIDSSLEQRSVLPWLLSSPHPPVASPLPPHSHA